MKNLVLISIFSVLPLKALAFSPVPDSYWTGSCKVNAKCVSRSGCQINDDKIVPFDGSFTEAKLINIMFDSTGESVVTNDVGSALRIEASELKFHADGTITSTQMVRKNITKGAISGNYTVANNTMDINVHGFTFTRGYNLETSVISVGLKDCKLQRVTQCVSSTQAHVL